MNDAQSDAATMHYAVCTVVGVFADEVALNAAVMQLWLAGFDRDAVSVLGTWATPAGSAAAIYVT